MAPDRQTGAVVKSLRPQNYNEVLYVGHFFRKGVPVLMDLSDVTDAEAKQIVDFATGLVFGRGGAMDRVDRRLFLLQP
ncbi:cell division protein SepF [Actinomadura spongiicola]|uniref:Cell division protein SepF n=1 Tax=Actinomadura spongiicola TaxID=2303421 RepID=A0A372GAK5_9ACTN|nr:cell division protein SepF [Actinomadura spongiicola]